MISMVLAPVIGAVAGGLLAHFVGCGPEGCPLLSSWWRGALVGGGLGLMIGLGGPARG